MINIKLINKIAKIGTDVFDNKKYAVSDSVENPVGLMVRSAKLHDTVFDKSTIAIARAGAGVNNIPCQRCADEGIVVFNTPGANANAVKELTLLALLLASRDVVDGVNWANTLEKDDEAGAKVEAGKGQFAGNELFGKTLGVIGVLGPLRMDYAKVLETIERLCGSVGEIMDEYSALAPPGKKNNVTKEIDIKDGNNDPS